MKITVQPDGDVELTEGPDRLVLSSSAFEDIRCALPLDSGSLFSFLNESILEEADDRAVLARIVTAGGGVDSAMEAFQALIRETETAPAPAPVPETAQPKRIGVLLVEADDWNARTTEEGIRGSAFTLDSRVRRIDDGLDHYRKTRSGLVVLNLTTPGAGEETIGGGLDPVRRFLDIDPGCRLLVTYSFSTKSLLTAAIRAGASGHLLLPAERKDLVSALTRALNSRTATPAPRGIVVKRNIVCQWKADSAGMLSGWKELLARSIDLKGIEGPLNTRLKEGEKVRLQIHLPADAKALEVQSVVATCKWDSTLRSGNVRFAYSKLSVEALARLSRFLAAEQSKSPPGRR